MRTKRLVKWHIEILAPPCFAHKRRQSSIFGDAGYGMGEVAGEAF
jgi:hypothetical protein